MNDVDRTYEKVRRILSPPFSAPLPKNELTDKLLRSIFDEEEASIIALGIRRAMFPATVGQISKRTGIPKKELRKKLKDMDYKGKLVKKGPLYLIPSYFPGLFECYFTANRDDPERIKKAGEAHHELIKTGFHMEEMRAGYPLFRVIPSAEPTMKTIEINKSMDVQHQVLPYEVLRKYLSRYRYFAVQQCPCRNAAKLAGEPCKRTDENFCVSAGILAREVVKRDIGRKVSLDEVMEVMKRAEKEGLVHESLNIQGASIFICQCCSCCCGFLKAIKEFGAYDAIGKSNFEPVINSEQCTLCETCMDICPMEAIHHSEETSDDRMIIEKEPCIGCGVCASNCPSDAITLEKVRDVTPIRTHLGMGGRFMKDRDIPAHFAFWGGYSPESSERE